jgi:hypothetical protein
MKPLAFVQFAVPSGRLDSFTIENVRGRYELSRREGEDRISLQTFTTEFELRTLIEESLPPVTTLAYPKEIAARSMLLALFLERTEGSSDEFSVRRRRKEIAQLREAKRKN